MYHLNNFQTFALKYNPPASIMWRVSNIKYKYLNLTDQFIMLET